MRAHLLVYDIPQGTKLKNPSGILRRMGARINLSCWIVPDKNVARIPVTEWREQGVKVELVRFDENDAATILRLAKQALSLELAEMRERLERNTEDLRTQLATVASGDEKAQQKAFEFASRSIRRAKKFVVSAEECALTFDLMGDVQAMVDGMRELIRAKDQLFYGWVKEVKDNRERRLRETQQEADLDVAANG